MISLFEYFCMELNISVPYGQSNDADKFEFSLITDDSEFVCVDGEEGDYGITKYYTKSGNELVAVETNRGGDDIEVEFTNVARIVFGKIVKDVIDENLKNMELYDTENI